MEFPISGIEANPLILVVIGFVVGILGGFFGVGGGFLAGPMMFWSGVPLNFVVGTDLAHMMGKSIVAARRHRALGNVDMRLGWLMVVGTIPGVEAGALVIERLEASGAIEYVIGISYIVILTIVGAFTAWESLRAIRMQRTSHLTAREVIGIPSAVYRSRLLRIPPLISLPVSGVAEVSIWVVLLVGAGTGFLAGMLGVGGGFLRVPLLVYLLSIVFSAGYGTLSHGLKGNVDILIALVMQTGAAIGAHIGAAATRYFTGPVLRLLFSILPLIGALLMLLQILR
jgi:uncharacterized membrane protein YfcA